MPYRGIDDDRASGCRSCPRLALFALAVLVLIVGLIAATGQRDRLDHVCRPARASSALAVCRARGQSLFDGAFVQDALALFAKRLFLGRDGAEPAWLADASVSRRSIAAPREYHFALLVSLIGMLVLASARELILLFVAFELMSIPLYVLTGFLKRDAVAPEAALKFFLVGTVSSAVIAYGMSFIYGVTGTTALAAIPQAHARGHPLMLLGMGLLLAGLGFKIAAFPFHMWAPDTYEAASTPFVAWLSVAPKARGSSPSSACISRASAARR